MSICMFFIFFLITITAPPMAPPAITTMATTPANGIGQVCGTVSVSSTSPQTVQRNSWFRLKMPRRSWLLPIRRHRVRSPESSLHMCPRRQNRCMSCFRPRCRWHPLFPLPRRYVPPDPFPRCKCPRRQSMCTLRCQLRYRWHPCCPLPRRYAYRSPGLLPAWFFPVRLFLYSVYPSVASDLPL